MTLALLEEVEKNKSEARAGEAFEAGRWREATGKTFEPFANQDNKSAPTVACCGCRKTVQTYPTCLTVTPLHCSGWQKPALQMILSHH